MRNDNEEYRPTFTAGEVVSKAELDMLPGEPTAYMLATGRLGGRRAKVVAKDKTVLFDSGDHVDNANAFDALAAWLRNQEGR